MQQGCNREHLTLTTSLQQGSREYKQLGGKIENLGHQIQCPEAVGNQAAMLVTLGPQKPHITLQHQEQTSDLL